MQYQRLEPGNVYFYKDKAWCYTFNEGFKDLTRAEAYCEALYGNMRVKFVHNDYPNLYKSFHHYGKQWAIRYKI
jgi:hypothetical protein